MTSSVPQTLRRWRIANAAPLPLGPWKDQPIVGLRPSSKGRGADRSCSLGPRTGMGGTAALDCMAACRPPEPSWPATSPHRPLTFGCHLATASGPPSAIDTETSSRQTNCSNEVQRPQPTKPPRLDPHRPDDLRRRPSLTTKHLGGKKKVYGRSAIPVQLP